MPSIVTLNFNTVKISGILSINTLSAIYALYAKIKMIMTITLTLILTMMKKYETLPCPFPAGLFPNISSTCTQSTWVDWNSLCPQEHNIMTEKLSGFKLGLLCSVSNTWNFYAMALFFSLSLVHMNDHDITTWGEVGVTTCKRKSQFLSSAIMLKSLCFCCVVVLQQCSNWWLFHYDITLCY